MLTYKKHRGSSVSAYLPRDLADWLAKQSFAEERTVSNIVVRALRFERDRVAAIHPKWGDIEYMTPDGPI